MKSLCPFVILLLSSLPCAAQEIDEAVTVQERHTNQDARQKYFLIQHTKSVKTNEKRGLILILPGGTGSKDFLPFCANVLTQYALPDDFVAAELVAPQWRDNENRIVWPSKAFPDKKATFTTEEFLDAVIQDVGKQVRIDERFVFTLGWSSSGHVLYSASTNSPKIRGSIVAMSRFQPGKSPKLNEVRGKNYFLYHSPDDRVCAYSEAAQAEKQLAEHGARVKLVTYKGGHGWIPGTMYCDQIQEGILWLKQMNSAPAEKSNSSTKPARPGKERVSAPSLPKEAPSTESPTR